MRGVTSASYAATCLEFMIGSNSVTVYDGGVCRVGVDGPISGGVISGPGSTSVFCEGKPVSLAGDLITPHGGCAALELSHCTALTQGSPTVIVGY